jgi:CubicO group peptidase (beta-lactamase class C family)
MDSAAMSTLSHDLRGHQWPTVRRLLIVRHGYLVLNEYLDGATPQELQRLQSATTTVTGILVGIAAREGEAASGRRNAGHGASRLPAATQGTVGSRTGRNAGVGREHERATLDRRAKWRGYTLDFGRMLWELPPIPGTADFGVVAAAGVRGQWIIVAPSRDLVVVATGDAVSVENHARAVQLLYDAILPAAH